MAESAKRGNKLSPGLKVVLVILAFVGPVVGASVLYHSFPALWPDSRSNQGILLQPVRPLPLGLELAPGGEPFKGQWTLLVVAPAGCGEACRERLDQTRKVRALMHDEATRVQRVLVTANPDAPKVFAAAHADLRVFAGGKRLAAFFEREAGGAASGPGVIHLIDPLGNWVLYYPAGMPAKAAFEDLKHLLKLSHIG